jgi:hypothetical protein
VSTPTQTTSPYGFEGGFPTPETVQRAYDDADLNRAVQAYRFFFPTVSGLAIFKGNEAVGVTANQVFGVLDTEPEQVGLTLNSDTPYGSILLDLRAGSMVVELPPGPLVGAALDLNQRWVADIGVPGPDAGNGGKHLLLPPDWTSEVPEGYYVARSTTYRVITGVRAIPLGGDVDGANDRISTIKVRPLDPRAGWTEPSWLDLNGQPQDTTPGAWETTLEYWRALHEVVDTEPHLDAYNALYGELAVLGIAKGQPFAPDERMTRILEQAARIGNGQLRVQSFADRRPDRVVWPDRQWQWAALRFENGDFYATDYLDVDAREKWFFQAIAASPAMFRRAAGAGSLYWLGLRDSDGAYLDGGKPYKLTVPQPVPGKLFWSLTVYDAETRSQIRTDQNQAALRSLFELADAGADAPVELYFGPDAPNGTEGRWIKTIPGKGWFVYFRIYGPEEPAFDGSWRLPDFESVS